jgi:hypothetical protein
MITLVITIIIPDSAKPGSKFSVVFFEGKIEVTFPISAQSDSLINVSISIGSNNAELSETLSPGWGVIFVLFPVGELCGTIDESLIEGCAEHPLKIDTSVNTHNIETKNIFPISLLSY